MGGGVMELETRSQEETRDLGAALAGLLTPGDVISLTGDLGAGKTRLVQGAARGLGVSEQVASPTFVLVREYHGDLPIYHLDVYRLNTLQEVLDLGFEDLLDPAAVIFIEWGDVIEPLLPESHAQIELSMPEGDGDLRRVRLTANGPSWAERWERLEKALDPWRAA